MAELKRKDGGHLVSVRYGHNRPSHLRDHAEWVYNEADIDRAKMVWAREMGDQQSDKLLHYYKDRTLGCLSWIDTIRLADSVVGRTGLDKWNRRRGAR